MKTISVDFFSTLNTHSEFWKELLKYAKLEGIQVYVISGPWPGKLKDALEFIGFVRKVHYDKVFSVLSHLSGKGLSVRFDEDKDSWFADDEFWWKAKAEICQKVKSHIHFDSDARFSKHFRYIPTRFVSTTSDPGKSIIGKWHSDLVSANTYDDLDEYEHIMGGMYAM